MWSRNINVFAQLEGNISPSPMVEFDTRLDKSYRQPRLPHSTTKHAKQPQPHWERGAWCNAAQLLLAAQHDRNLWTETPPTATSCHPFPQCIAWQPLCNKQLATPPHSVKERSQGTLQAARWTRLHFSLVCSESAAFNHSLTAAAGSTGSGAMPLSLWAENLSLLYLRNLDPSMQYTHRNSTFRFQKCGVSALNVFIVPFIAAPKLTPWALTSQGRITSGNALFNTGLACTSRDRNDEAFDPSILRTEVKQIV